MFFQFVHLFSELDQLWNTKEEQRQKLYSSSFPSRKIPHQMKQITEVSTYLGFDHSQLYVIILDMSSYQEGEKKNQFSDETLEVKTETKLPLSRISIQKYLGKGRFGQCYRIRFDDTMGLLWIDEKGQKVHIFDINYALKYKQERPSKILKYQKMKQEKEKKKKQSGEPPQKQDDQYHDKQGDILHQISQYCSNDKQGHKIQRHFVKFYHKGCILDESKQFDRSYIIMEHCVKGNLDNVYKLQLSFEEKFYIVSQVLMAIMYLNTMNFMHRDIKLANILFDSDYNVKLCDFGSAYGSTQNKMQASKIIGTDGYKAPQMLKNQNIPTEKRKCYGVKVDVYSLGCVAFKLLYNIDRKKYDSAQLQQKLKQRQSEEDPHEQSLKQLTLQMLQQQPEKRQTAKELFQKFKDKIKKIQIKKVKQSLADKQQFPRKVMVKSIFFINKIGLMIILTNARTFIYLFKHKDKDKLIDCEKSQSIKKTLKYLKQKSRDKSLDKAFYKQINDPAAKQETQYFLAFLNHHPQALRLIWQTRRTQEAELYIENKDKPSLYDKIVKPTVSSISIPIGENPIIFIKLTNGVLQCFFPNKQLDQGNYKFQTSINFNTFQRKQDKLKIEMTLIQAQTDNFSSKQFSNIEEILNDQRFSKFGKYIQKVAESKYSQGKKGKSKPKRADS